MAANPSWEKSISIVSYHWSHFHSLWLSIANDFRKGKNHLVLKLSDHVIPLSDHVTPLIQIKSLHCPIMWLHCPIILLLSLIMWHHCPIMWLLYPIMWLHCLVRWLLCPMKWLHCPVIWLHCPIIWLLCLIMWLHCPMCLAIHFTSVCLSQNIIEYLYGVVVSRLPSFHFPMELHTIINSRPIRQQKIEEDLNAHGDEN